MSEKQSGIGGYFEELKRRKVIRVAIAYVVGAWVLMQVADATFEPLNLPQWSTTLVLWLLALGFPVALILAWALEVTPEGIRRTRKQRRKPASATKQATSTQTEHSIAVLPFSDMSPEKDQDHFCEGMAEEIDRVVLGCRPGQVVRLGGVVTSVQVMVVDRHAVGPERQQVAGSERLSDDRHRAARHVGH